MAIIYMGDFRCRSLQRVYEIGSLSDVEASYIIEDFGTSSWLSSGASYKLDELSPIPSSIVIMTGFLDCVNSCIWDNFKIEDIVANYKATLNHYVSNYVGHTFYFCSVNPVNGAYSTAYVSSGKISKDTLNNKIKSFNKAMKKDCPVTFIDSYDYLKDTKYILRDGIRYSSETAESLHSYLLSQVNLDSLTVESSFMSSKRITAADAPNENDESMKYWTHTSYGGLNDCIKIAGTRYTIPNCVGYAWGRFYEITGEKPKLSRSDAGEWYGYTSDGYTRSKTTPKEGAVCCWSKPGAAGHVAIVEQINEDGSVIMSESGYRDEAYKPSEHFWTPTRTNSDGHWGLKSGGYVFQGFIYCPQTTIKTETDTYSENTYDNSRADMAPNAQYIWQYLGSRGWTKQAVAGLLGNIERESRMSPCVWEGCINGSTITNGKHTVNQSYLDSIGFSGGYGLTQWTPYSKLMKWCKDGKVNGTGKTLSYWTLETQLLKILDEVKASTEGGWEELRDQWIAKSAYGGMSFTEFTQSKKDAKYLAEVFCNSYERPGVPAMEERKAAAEYWYSQLGGISNTVLSITTSAQFRVNSFKIDEKTSVSAQASFVVTCGTSYEYTLKKGSKKIASGKKELETDEKVVLIKLISLEPDTDYSLKLEVKGENDASFNETLKFTTTQSYPECVEAIELIPNLIDGYKNATSDFTLKVTKPSALGVWKNNSNGYELCLYVNGSKKKKVIEISKATDLSLTKLNLKDYFDYTCKTGDVIQVGIRTWVKTDSNDTLYNQSGIKTSKPICLLEQAVRAFMNLKT